MRLDREGARKEKVYAPPLRLSAPGEGMNAIILLAAMSLAIVTAPSATASCHYYCQDPADNVVHTVEGVQGVASWLSSQVPIVVSVSVATMGAAMIAVWLARARA